MSLPREEPFLFPILLSAKYYDVSFALGAVQPLVPRNLLKLEFPSLCVIPTPIDSDYFHRITLLLPIFKLSFWVWHPEVVWRSGCDTYGGVPF